MYEYIPVVHELTGTNPEEILASLEREFGSLASEGWEILQAFPGSFQLESDYERQWLVAKTLILICRCNPDEDDTPVNKVQSST